MDIEIGNWYVFRKIRG